MRGDNVLRDMSVQINALRSRADELATQLQAMTSEREQSRIAEASRTRELARIRLDLLAANAVESRIDAADRRARELLAARDAAMLRSQADIADAEARVTHATATRDAALAVRDEALAARDALVAATRDAVSARSDYQALQEQAADLGEQAALAHRKAETAAADRAVKRVPYEADRLFMYLWQRRFGFPEYAASPLVRTGDGFVARTIGYDGAARNYRMLLALADHLKAHADAKAEQAADVQAQLLAVEQQALAEAGLSVREEAVTQADAALAQAGQALAATEQALDAALAARAALVAGQDPHSLEAMSVLSAQIGREAIEELSADARATSAGGDDVQVVALAEARDRYAALAPRMAELEQEQQRVLAQITQAEALRTRFRGAAYDGGDSRFDDGFVIGTVLQQLLRGAVQMNDVWREIERHHRRLPSRPPRQRRDDRGRSGRDIGVFGDVFGGSMGGGIGPFGGSSGGHSGGGGFGTGGGFGGGGGFKTGGGF